MSWTCPYEVNGNCKRLEKLCQPGIKGCILNKIKFLDSSEQDLSAGKINLKNED